MSLDSTYEVETPFCSSRDLDVKKRLWKRESTRDEPLRKIEESDSEEELNHVAVGKGTM